MTHSPTKPMKNSASASNPRFITNLVIENLVAIDNKSYAVRTHDTIAKQNFAQYLQRITRGSTRFPY